MAACAPCPKSVGDSLAFDPVAERYDRTRPIPPLVARQFAECVARNIENQQWILDVGFGTGRIGLPIAKRHARTVGADLSQNMLLQTPDTKPPVPRVRADARALPFPNGAFQRVVVVHLLHLIPDWRQAMAEITRVCAPGGSIWLGFEQRGSDAGRLALAEMIRRGHAQPHPGASEDLIRDWLANSGWSCRVHQPMSWRWTNQRSHGDLQEEIRLKTWSALWQSTNADIEAGIELLDAFVANGHPTDARSRFHAVEAKRSL